MRVDPRAVAVPGQVGRPTLQRDSRARGRGPSRAGRYARSSGRRSALTLARAGPAIC